MAFSVGFLQTLHSEQWKPEPSLSLWELECSSPQSCLLTLCPTTWIFTLCIWFSTVSEESRSSLDKLWSLFLFSWVVYSSPKLCSETASAFRISRFCILSSQLSKATANILPDGWSRNVLEETLNDRKPLLPSSSLKGFSHKLPSSQDLNCVISHDWSILFFNCLVVVKLNPTFKKPLFLEKRASAFSFNWSEAKVLVKVSLKRVDWRTSGQNLGKTNEKHTWSDREILNHAVFIFNTLTWLPKSSRTHIFIDSQSGLPTLPSWMFDKSVITLNKHSNIQ